MKNLFLYRLYKNAPIAAILVTVFLLLYSIFFYKKIDALLFPYNNMFTQQLNPNFVATSYVIKINKVPVAITNNWYQKKDFSEATLTSFSKWILNNKQGYMNDFVQQKTNNAQITATYTNKLFVDTTIAITWPAWFAKFNNIVVNNSDTVTIWQYNVQTNATPVFIKDSVLIFTNIITQ